MRKKFFYVFFVLIIAVVGFWMGRSTGLGNLTIKHPATTNNFYPLPPTPPETQTYNPEMTTETEIEVETPSDSVEVNVYFANNNLDPWITCGKVFPVRRQLSSNGNIYRAAIEALLAGPDDNEKKNRYETLLPVGVVLKSVAADAKGTITADFDDHLDREVAGSCRVSLIRAQIEATLQQFPEVRQVVISINGDKEEILQP